LAFAQDVRDLFRRAEANHTVPDPDDMVRALRAGFLRRRTVQAKVFKEMQIPATNPLTLSYFSQVPFRFGEGRAVKYAVRPTSAAPQIPPYDDPTRWARALTEHLKTTDATFDFFVQLQEDPAAMPIEDALVEWSEELSPYVRVATITIPQQEITNAEQLSFAPFHALKDH